MHESNEQEVPAETVREVSAEADQSMEVDLHEDRTREFRTPGFHRMRTDWSGPDGAVVRSISGIVDGMLLKAFADAYSVMNELYGIVRQPIANQATGEVMTDQFGWPIWQRRPDGSFIEDYSRLTMRDREDLLFQITTRLFEWEQRASDAWAEAMYAKAQFEERFATGYTNAIGKKATVDDRIQSGRLYSAEERYFGIFKSHYSRKADALVRAMTLLGQRLKDTLA